MNCKNCIHFNVCEKAKKPENYAFPSCKDYKCKENYTEVVRCKNCPYVSFNSSSETYHCNRRYFTVPVEENDFCSYCEKTKGGE